MQYCLLYTQPNCALCNDAEIQINLAASEIELSYTAVNIKEDDRLHEKYCMRVPVLIDKENNQIIQEGNIDFVTIIEYFS